jgi:hypothetical protein
LLNIIVQLASKMGFYKKKITLQQIFPRRPIKEDEIGWVCSAHGMRGKCMYRNIPRDGGAVGKILKTHGVRV